MMASTHIAFGMSCWLGYAKLRGLPVEPIPIAIAAAASLLPDIDHPKSAFGRVVPFVSIPISLVFGHRGITHSLFAIAGLTVALWFYHEDWYVVPIVIGYLSHLGGDMMTNSGVPFFWPSKNKLALSLFNTDSLVEGLVRIGLGAFIVWDVWGMLKPMLVHIYPNIA